MIAGINPCSFVDYPGILSIVVYTQGCNMRCTYCHNHQLTNLNTSKRIGLDGLYAELAKTTLEALVVTGGEPTLHDTRPIFELAQAMGIKRCKLDTNGTNLCKVKALVEGGYLNYVAVDIKSAFPLPLQTLEYLQEVGIPCEARTTIDGKLHNAADLQVMGNAIKRTGLRHWYLQQANSTSKFNATMFPTNTLPMIPGLEIVLR